MNIKQNFLELSGVEITKSILIDLQKLSSYSGELIASIYADNLLHRQNSNTYYKSSKPV